jgi:hypothetical protein
MILLDNYLFLVLSIEHFVEKESGVTTAQEDPYAGPDGL